MRETLSQLAELREIDAQIHGLREQLALYPKMLAQLAAKEAAAKKAEQQAGESFTHARESRRRGELDIAALREKINKYLLQQNQVKSNKEFEAITHEIATVRGRIDEHENAALMALEDEERFDNLKAEMLAKREKLVGENDAERERIRLQSTEKKDRLARLEAERAAQLDRVPAEFQELYDMLNARFPGTGLAPIADEACGGCSRKLTAQLARAVHQGDQLVRCESCSRIVYDPKGIQ